MSIFDTIKRLLGLDKKPLTPLPTQVLTKQEYSGRSGGGYSSDSYLIEIRFINRKLKSQLKDLEYYLDKKFGIGKHHYVPHITLVGGFSTKDENRLINDFFSISSKSPIVKLSMNGFDSFDSNKNGLTNKIVYFNVQASDELKELRYYLSQSLRSYCHLNTFDFHASEEFVFHATLANHVPEKIFFAIKNYLQKNPFEFNDYVVPRITLLKNAHIIREYDFFLEKLLTHTEARDPYYYRRTEEQVQQHLKNNRGRSKTEKVPLNITESQIFLFSDTHFDHENIIRYCNRPFSSIRDMNRILMNNWNSVVNPRDTVYFLGDLSYGRKSHSETFWMEKLNGHKVFIKGSHDDGHNIKTYTHLVLNHKNKQFYLVHDPYDAPIDWGDWIIHGHIHNNDLAKFPFINGRKKRINVSAELLNYQPLNIETLFKMNFESIDRLETLPPD